MVFSSGRAQQSRDDEDGHGCSRIRSGGRHDEEDDGEPGDDARWCFFLRPCFWWRWKTQATVKGLETWREISDEIWVFHDIRYATTKRYIHTILINIGWQWYLFVWKQPGWTSGSSDLLETCPFAWGWMPWRIWWRTCRPNRCRRWWRWAWRWNQVVVIPKTPPRCWTTPRWWRPPGIGRFFFFPKQKTTIATLKKKMFLKNLRWFQNWWYFQWYFESS